MSTESKFTPPGFESLTGAMTGTGRVVALGDCRQVSWKVIYTGTAPTAGTLLIEQAPSPTYSGTWNQLDSIALTNLSAGTVGFGTRAGQVDFMRARFTVDSNQPVTAYLNGLLK